MAVSTPGISTPESTVPSASMAGTPLVKLVSNPPALNDCFTVMKDALFGDTCDATVWIDSKPVDATMSNFINSVPSATQNIETSLFFNDWKSNMKFGFEI